MRAKPRCGQGMPFLSKMTTADVFQGVLRNGQGFRRLSAGPKQNPSSSRDCACDRRGAAALPAFGQAGLA